MCWADRCCLCLRLDLGGILIGVISFMISIASMASSVSLLCLDVFATEAVHPPGYTRQFISLDMNRSSYHIVLVMLLVLSSLGVVSSCLLVHGLRKTKPGLLLCYFGHGIIQVIMMLLSALLVLLAKNWALAMGLVIAAMIFVQWLVVVHTIYDLMSKGERFGADATDDEETLIEGSLSLESDLRA